MVLRQIGVGERRSISSAAQREGTLRPTSKAVRVGNASESLRWDAELALPCLTLPFHTTGIRIITSKKNKTWRLPPHQVVRGRPSRPSSAGLEASVTSFEIESRASGKLSVLASRRFPQEPRAPSSFLRGLVKSEGTHGAPDERLFALCFGGYLSRYQQLCSSQPQESR